MKFKTSASINTCCSLCQIRSSCSSLLMEHNTRQRSLSVFRHFQAPSSARGLHEPGIPGRQAGAERERETRQREKNEAKTKFSLIKACEFTKRLCLKGGRSIPPPTTTTTDTRKLHRLPRQFYLFGTNYSNTSAYGGHSHLHHNRTNVFLWLCREYN